MKRPWLTPTLDRYLALTLAQTVGLALATLVAAFSVINATEELQRVGTGQYGVAAALRFVLGTLPYEAYRLLPAAALLGTLIGLGGLARRHELTAIQAAGVPRARIVWSIVQAVAILVIAAVLLAELVTTPLTYRARRQRSAALSGGRALAMEGGIWTRAGSRFVNIRTVLASGAAHDVYVYDFDTQRRMRRFTYARAATFADHQWTLEDLVDKVIDEQGVVTDRMAARPLALELDPNQLSLMRIPPAELALVDLATAIRAARRRGENADQLALAWWQRAMQPVVTGIMIFLAAALILSAQLTLPLGRLIIVGALLGVGFQLFSQTFASFGLVYGLPHWVSALFPALLALGAGGWCLTRSPR